LEQDARARIGAHTSPFEADLRAGRVALVTPSALADDPVRVLRLARIADALGFTVDPAARDAARRAAPAIADAPGERVMEEFGRIIRAADPGRAVGALDEVGGLGGLIPQLEDCRGVEQSEYHHLDVLGHTLEVLDQNHHALKTYTAAGFKRYSLQPGAGEAIFLAKSLG
jgi:tRNA nucleotidyltransferase/poly(A) polymerase